MVNAFLRMLDWEVRANIWRPLILLAKANKRPKAVVIAQKSVSHDLGEGKVSSIDFDVETHKLTMTCAGLDPVRWRGLLGREDTR